MDNPGHGCAAVYNVWITFLNILVDRLDRNCYNCGLVTKRPSMYAIISPTTFATHFYYTFAAAEQACIAYNVIPGQKVYIIDFSESKIEQL